MCCFPLARVLSRRLRPASRGAEDCSIVLLGGQECLRHRSHFPAIGELSERIDLTVKRSSLFLRKSLRKGTPCGCTLSLHFMIFSNSKISLSARPISTSIAPKAMDFAIFLLLSSFSKKTDIVLRSRMRFLLLQIVSATSRVSTGNPEKINGHSFSFDSTAPAARLRCLIAFSL